MSVKRFCWGVVCGGSNSDGGAVISATALYGPDDPYVGTLGAGDTTITFMQLTKGVSVRNTHDTQSLEYSFDAGATWLLLAPYGEIKEFVNVATLVLRNAGPVGTTYEVVAILTS